jgi:predicted GNAT family N-acyltransferase
LLLTSTGNGGGCRDMQIFEADFTREHADIRRVRFTVFVDEQNVPPELEMDDRDDACLHWLARDTAGSAVGTVRLDIENNGKVGRLAVLAEARRRGVGRALMEHLHTAARERGLSRIWCHAQISAVPFYRRLGYRITSEPFDEAGIEHVTMELAL